MKWKRINFYFLAQLAEKLRFKVGVAMAPPRQEAEKYN